MRVSQFAWKYKELLALLFWSVVFSFMALMCTGSLIRGQEADNALSFQEQKERDEQYRANHKPRSNYRYGRYYGPFGGP